ARWSGSSSPLPHRTSASTSFTAWGSEARASRGRTKKGALLSHDEPLLINGRQAAEVPLRHVWHECVGSGRANEALRADWQAHFREAVSLLGARYVRFHGIFHDDMFVYRVSNGGGFGPPAELPEPVYTFAYVDKVFDAILDAGARPFVEL